MWDVRLSQNDHFCVENEHIALLRKRIDLRLKKLHFGTASRI